MQQQIACTVCKQNSVLVILILLIVLSSQQPFQDVDKVSSFLLTTTVDTNAVSTPNLHSSALEAILMGSLSTVPFSGPTVFQQQTEDAGKKATASEGTEGEARSVVGGAARHKDAINDGSGQVDWRV